MKPLEFPDIDLALKSEESCFRIGNDLDDVFPYLRNDTVTMGSQFAGPWDVMSAAVRWLWLTILRDSPKDEVARVIAYLVRRSVGAIRLSGGSYYRAEHDVILMTASILSGNRELMHIASEAVRVADPKSESYQFFEAWAGILRSRILNQHDDEEEQLSILLRKRGVSLMQCPSHSLAKAFCKRDYKKMALLMNKTFEKEWADGEKTGSIEHDPSGATKVFLRFRDPNMYWPWAQAGFAKLAILEAAKVPTHPLWLPDRLLSFSL